MNVERYDDEPEVVPKCYLCRHFVRGTWGDRINPPEPAECNHPVANVSSTLPNFPFANGCKHFEAKAKEVSR